MDYQHGGQPLFIPEQRRDEHGARRIWSAFGTFHALCASPFGIDTLGPVDKVWAKHFGLLSQVSEYVLAAQEGKYQSIGFFFDELGNDEVNSESTKVSFGDWALTVDRAFVFGKPGPGFGMVIHLGDVRFLLVGQGFRVRFVSLKQGAVFTGILSFIEKIYDHHTKELKNGRTLNGDETHSGEFVNMPNEQPDYGDFPIPITIPARTSIAECEVYALF